MPVFTLILEYLGGTYVSQVVARDVRLAQIAWAKSLKPGEVKGLGAKRLAHLVQELEQDPSRIYSPVPLKNLSRVWCGGSTYGLLNIVQTDTER